MYIGVYNVHFDELGGRIQGLFSAVARAPSTAGPFRNEWIRLRLWLRWSQSFWGSIRNCMLRIWLEPAKPKSLIHSFWKGPRPRAADVHWGWYLVVCMYIIRKRTPVYSSNLSFCYMNTIIIMQGTSLDITCHGQTRLNHRHTCNKKTTVSIVSAGRLDGFPPSLSLETFVGNEISHWDKVDITGTTRPLQICVHKIATRHMQVGL